MTPGDYGQPTPPPGTWTTSPPPSSDGTWPPPPTPNGAWPPAPQTALFVPFKYVPRRASGKEVSRARLSDFREGTIQADQNGLLINGKAVLRAEIRYPIFIVAFLIFRLIGIIAYLAMEYGFRKDATHQVPWDAVRLVQVAPQKSQACVVYDAPNYKGVVKTFTLAFTLDPAYLPALAQQVQQYAPGRLTEGNLRGVTTVRTWIRLVIVLIAIVAAIYAALYQHH